jgi:hypothetical protein
LIAEHRARVVNQREHDWQIGEYYGVMLLSASGMVMLAHAANNAFALWAGLQGFPLTELDPWMYAAAAVVFALWALSGLYVVQPNEQGVVTTFGAYSRDDFNSGAINPAIWETFVLDPLPASFFAIT